LNPDLILNKYRSNSGKPFYKKFRIRLAKKFAIARAPKKFQSTPHPPLEIFHLTLGIIKRILTPENQKFCSMYMHFVG